MTPEQDKESESKEKEKGEVELVLRRPADLSDEALRKLAAEMFKALKAKPEDKDPEAQS
jgi:hypothetical protein